MKFRRLRLSSPFASLYAEIQATPQRARSIRSMFFANLFGNMHGIICASGTTAMIWYDGEYIMESSNPVMTQGRQLPNAFVYERAH